MSRLPAISVVDTLSLAPGIVDLWYCLPEADDAPPLDTHEALLSPDERERHRRHHFERHRRLFLASRVLVRTVLSRYAAVGPAEWRFAAGEQGKPRISHPSVTPSLHFNLSHTRGLAVCAVSVAHESLGVDAEWLGGATPLEIAGRHFSPPEVRALATLPPSEQPRRFFTYWTLKESYIKARGLGLALPLDAFSFLVDGDAIAIHFDTGLEDDAARWRFALLDAPPFHMIAVGVDTAGAPLSLRATRVEPFPGSPGPPPSL